MPHLELVVELDVVDVVTAEDVVIAVDVAIKEAEDAVVSRDEEVLADVELDARGVTAVVQDTMDRATDPTPLYAGAATSRATAYQDAPDREDAPSATRAT